MALLHIASRRRKGSADSVHKIAGHLIEYRDVASHRIASHRIASHRIASHRIASHRIGRSYSSLSLYALR